MPRRLFNKLVYRHRVAGNPWYLRPFAKILGDPALWSTNRKSVLRAFALGLFIGLMLIPGHMIFAGMAAIYLRVNLPVAVISTLVTNPVTIGPLLYMDYRVGLFLLGAPIETTDFQWTLAAVTERLGQTWKPLLLGSAVVAPLVAATGYGVLNLVWRISTGIRFRQRRRRRAD